ncbi:hypothetical protein OE88DRAFT_777872 [Heliocybe sulcata]|uniref:RBR-type E3 ubiquitin transferase n=1 Tax=Heliocybe sulcata TaxID=5364 RepID=A0A5C3MT36_9AGAM|nr:hypothetical protein OE88DRAFT_777872 [Heliocybe sulcata]
MLAEQTNDTLLQPSTMSLENLDFSTTHESPQVKLPKVRKRALRRCRRSRDRRKYQSTAADTIDDTQVFPVQELSGPCRGSDFAATAVGLPDISKGLDGHINVVLRSKVDPPLPDRWGKPSDVPAKPYAKSPDALKDKPRDSKYVSVSVRDVGTSMTNGRVTSKHVEPRRSSLPHQIPSSEPSRVYYVDEASDVHDMMVFNSTKVSFGPGFHVVGVVTGFESRWVILSNIPRGTDEGSVRDILSPFGQVIETWRHLDRNHHTTMSIRARFADTKQATEAVAALNGAEVLGTTIHARLPPNNMKSGRAEIQDTCIRFTWDAPGWTGYAGYETLTAAEKAMDLARRDKKWGKAIVPSIHEGIPTLGPVTVAFRCMPNDLKLAYLRNFGRPEDTMQQASKTAPVGLVSNAIRQVLQDFGDKVTFRQSPGPYIDGKVHLHAYFLDSSSAAAARDLFVEPPEAIRSIKNASLSVEHMQSISYSLGSEIFNVMKGDVDELRRKFEALHPDNTIVESQENLTSVVELHATDLKSLGDLKQGFERILRGEVLKENGQYVWDTFFSTAAGFAFLSELQQQNPAVQIQSSKRTHKITLHGSASARLKVRTGILEQVETLRECKTLCIPIPRRLVGPFLKMRLRLLQEQIGYENLRVDFASPSVLVRGDKALELVRVAVQEALHSRVTSRTGDVAKCPICLDEPTRPIVLRCGHAWCKACLTNYFTAATESRTFPMTCLGDEGACSCGIPVAVAREVLGSDEFDELAASALTAHVRTHPDEYRWCPGPDCEEIYRIGPADTVLTCPRCLRRVCVHCHIEHHEGMTCAEFKEGLEPEFARWRAGKNVKHCPKCRTAIEKVDGCNHMTCVVCQVHICWVCLKIFEKGEAVYDHMRWKHGGIGA